MRKQSGCGLGIATVNTMASTFRDRELARIRLSGWVGNPRIQALVETSGLPSPLTFLAELLTDAQWQAAHRAVTLLREKFSAFRFADQVDYGIVLVPSPRHLDTRTLVPAGIRASQHPDLGEDFLDPALGDGVDLTDPALPWTPFVTVTGAYGMSAGSCHDVTGAHADDFTVGGYDTRIAMTRQLWGARLLQAPAGCVPDNDYNETWTFTLFPGEPLVDGQAVSATVLKGRVRFRLGKANRGIGSARVAPAVPLAAMSSL